MRPPVTVNGRPTKEYIAYKSMVARCTLTMASWRERYQGTIYDGLEIEPDWLGPDGYSRFYSDLGPAPGGTVLDRIDNDKGYVRGNVRWATIQQSNRNKSNTRLITVFGETRSIGEWADLIGITPNAIQRRIDLLGWSDEDAVMKHPSMNGRPRNELFFMQIAGRVAKRSTCIRRAVGCVLVDSRKHIISTAYNSVPEGFHNCVDSPCEGSGYPSGSGLSKCQAEHAETLALFRCKDISQIDTCYSTTSPCELCVRRLLDTSCKKIVWVESYPDHTKCGEIWRSYGREWVELDEDLEDFDDIPF